MTTTTPKRLAAIRLPGGQAPLYRQVCDAMSGAIAEAEFAPTEKLPTEQELAEHLGLNRLTVRRAYQDLKERGLIIQRRGSGSFVTADAMKRLKVAPKRRLRQVAFAFNVANFHSRRSYIIMELLEGVADRLRNRNADLCHLPVDVGADTEKLLQWFRRFDGIIVQGDLTRTLPQPIWSTLRKEGIPVVATLMSPIITDMPSVHYDRRTAARQAVNHLVQWGSRRLAYVGPLESEVAQAKTAGFLDGLRQHGLALEAGFQIGVQRTPGEGFAVARRLMNADRMPDGIFVDGDFVACELIQALTDASVSVPQDVAVVGYDDIPEAAQCRPSLTSVRPPRREIGQTAADLLSRWQPDTPAPRSIIMDAQIIVRQSCPSTFEGSEPRKGDT